jgi:glucose-1-phosphate cytidylyltransferase
MRKPAAGDLVESSLTGFWQPMDTLREHKRVNEMWADGKPPWKTW